ncbi:MAG: CIA30 family protein [Spirochaetales bacterium]
MLIRPKLWNVSLVAVAILGTACVTTTPVSEVPVSPFLLDDFSSSSSRLGTSWQGFTDRVMGGLSDMKVGTESEGGIPHLVISGQVSLKNNGGFIQAQLLLAHDGKPVFDARRYTGVRLLARVNSEGYYLFLRTSRNLFPWSFYMAPLPVTGEWQEVHVPFSQFTKGDFGAFFSLDLAELASVAVVAYKREFSARIDVREIGFY